MPGGLDPRRDAADAVLARLLGPEASARAGAAEVVRDGAALLVRQGDVLVRVRPPEGRPVAEREVQLARVLDALQVPTTALIEPGDQPWDVDGHVITAWRWETGGTRVSPGDLGFLALVLRQQTAVAGAAVPVFDPLAAIVDAVAHLPADDPEAVFVRERAADLLGDWDEAAASDPLGRAIVHGDLHRQNVVPGPHGPLLTDLELSGGGPSAYDAAPAVVAVSRYGAPARGLDDFLAAFGDDPRGRPQFDVFVAVYELWVTAWAVGVRHQDPTWASEASRRVATLRDGLAEPWTLR